MAFDSSVRSLRFYRSRLFWCGAVVFLFLTWVWWDSGRTGTVVLWERGVREYSGWLSDGEVGWERREHLDGYVAGHGISGNRYPILGDYEPRGRGFGFPAAFESEDDESEGVRLKEWRVAMWLVLILYGVMWMAVVVWWQRRRARLVKGTRGEAGGE